MREGKSTNQIVKRDSARFAAVCNALLREGIAAKFTAEGESMRPNILPEDHVVVAPVATGELRPGLVVLAQGSDGLRVHRMVRRVAEGSAAITRGDAGQENDAGPNFVLGKVTAIEREGERISFTTPGMQLVHGSRTGFRRIQQAVRLRWKNLRTSFLVLPFLIFAGALFGPAPATAATSITLTDTASVTTVAANGTITYTLVLTNTGTTTITRPLTVTDNLSALTPTGTATKTSGTGAWTCAVAAGVATCTENAGSNFTAGSATTFTIVATVTGSPGPDGTTIVDTASAQGANPVTASAPSTTVTVQTPSLSTTMSAAPNPVFAGANITYTETVKNAGPDAAPVTGTSLTQSTPTGTTFVSATPAAGWTCGTTPAVGGTGAISCAPNAAIASGTTTGNFTFVVAVNPNVAGGTVITNTATINETGTDPVSNTSSANVTVNTDLSITNTPGTTFVAPGGTITYTQVMSNASGVSVAQPLTVTQNLPANTTFVSAAMTAGHDTWTCANVAGTITCTDTTAGAYASGNSTTFTVVVTVNPATASGTVIADTVSAKGTATASASATANVTVQIPDLSVTETAAPNPVGPGANLTYTETVTNNSTAAAVGASLTQNTPANTTFVSATPPAGWACGTVPAVGGTGAITCTSAGTFAGGASVNFAIVVATSAALTNGSTVSNSVTVSETATDPVPANNTATSSVTVTAADLSTTQTAAPNPVATGGTITYTEAVTNNSATAAAGATLTQSTPANTTFASATPPAGWTCGTTPAVGGTGTITCTANGMLAGSSTTGNFTIVVNVNPAAVGGSTITNTATVSETGTDPIPGNNTSSSSVTVSGADLAMTQTARRHRRRPGATITYTETVTNNGPNSATGATLYQQTPPNTTFSSITPPTGWTCGTQPAAGATGSVICSDGTALASGTTTPAFTFVVTVGGATAAGTTILNWADVTSQTTDPVAFNNATTTSVLVEVTGNSDLAISSTALPTPVFVSSPITYTIQVTNLGLAAGTAVQVVDTLPATLATASATTSQGTCGAQTGGTVVGGVTFGGTITCTLGSVAYPLATPIIITVSGTTPTTATTLTNTAVVSTTGTDPVTTNNSSTVLTVVQPLVCATPGKDGVPSTPLTGIVNTYYAGVGSPAAGTNSLTVTTPSSGSATQVGAGDLLLVMQMQGAQINVTNTSSYGDGVAGNPASGSTSLGNSGQFEFVTVTGVTTGATTDTLTIAGTGAGGGLLNSYASVAASNISVPPQGAQTFQVIRVPQYTTATLSSGLAAFGWNGAVGGVLVLDIASQLTLGGTVSLDGQGFRGGGGMILAGGAGASTDVVTLSTITTDASKGEGIAGTPHFIAPPLGSIVLTTTATSTAQTYLEGYPSGSFARGAPANAGGGATDADPVGNDQNSGGGAGANGGTGGAGGFGWSSAGLVGGFGGVAFPASTSALIMGGGGGAGTTNNGTSWNPVTNTGPANNCGANCTGIFSSGTAGGGIVIIHAGSVTGTGTISASGQTALQVENDGGGGGGAGGAIVLLANSGLLGGLTAIAAGGSGGITWPEDAPGTPFPGNRHGPGGGGGGGVIFTSTAPGSFSVSGGNPGTTTLANDAYGATPGQAGLQASGVTITQTPGTQSGAFCASADLSVTNSGSPNPVTPTGVITYVQTVANAGPLDALNAVFSEAIPANTTFQSITAPAGWACNSTASILATGNITCSNPDVPSGGSGTGTFTVNVTVNAGTTFGTQIQDTATVTSGTTDPNLANNSASVTTVVGSGTSAYVTLTKTAASPTVVAGQNITYTMVMNNLGPAAAAPNGLYDTVPTNTTFVSITAPGFSCTAPAVGATGNIACTIASFANGATATFTLVVKVNAGVASGTVISNTASASSPIPNPNPTAASATANVTVAGATQADLSITSSVTPNPIFNNSANPTFIQIVTNNGPAAVATATYTDNVPTGSTFVSLVPPAGWLCSAPTGPSNTITCTGPLAVGASATFPLVVKASSTDTAGTVISNTATIGPTANDPNTANNTATSSTILASPSQADVTITKTASPEPVDQGTNLTYTIQVQNGGPAVATGVNVSDPLPTQVTFTSVSTTQGTCTQASGTVSCSIGTVGVGGIVLITINVNASVFSSSTVPCPALPITNPQFSACNTATVTTTSSNPNAAPVTASAGSTIQSPTAVQLSSFRAFARPQGGVLLEWHTQEEVRNLGFNVYREDSQGRQRVNPSIIAGAALFVRGGRPQHGAKTYYWIDPAGGQESSYVLEDVDLNGTRSTHGPANPETTSETASATTRAFLSASAAPQVAAAEALSTTQVSNAALLTQLNKLSLAASPVLLPARALNVPRPKLPTLTPGQYQVSLDGQQALKIGVQSEGWYRISRAQMAAAGFDPGWNAAYLQLFAEGVEQPIVVITQPGSGLRPVQAIEFYGTGIDTPYSGTRVYWLAHGTQPGKRVAPIQATTSGAANAQDFLSTVVHEDRTTYFATLLNGEDQDNFFGDGVTSQAVDETITVAHSNSHSSLPTSIDVTLQGATDQQTHRVAVSFNGNTIGEMDFNNQANVTNTFPVDSSLLHDGANTVTLASLDGDNDVSLVQSIQLHYPHTYAADANWLRATAPSGSSVSVTGFTSSQIFVFDISDPQSITRLVGNVDAQGNTFSIALAVPNTGGATHTLLVFSADQISAAASVTLHQPDPAIHAPQPAGIVVISHPDFVSSLAPLVALHKSQGHQVSIVTTEQIYDAFNFGERTPYALRAYLQQLASQPEQAPRAVLLVGDASLDPRNYLGFGDFDFVPTRIIETAAFKTASDDWFSDFAQTGFATIPTGRLPVRTAADAALVIAKIVGYESGSSAGSWNQQAVLIADQNVGVDFTKETSFAAAEIPTSLQTTKILSDGLDVATAQQQILTALNGGALLVNYTGHGSTEQWSFANLLDDDSANALSNGNRLPFFLLMDCLNGFFQDVYTQSLAESLLLAPNGGGVAVWASSGFTTAPAQASMDQSLLRILKETPSTPLGEGILGAKLGIGDPDVRRTWILFGDPAMQLQLPASASGTTMPRRLSSKRNEKQQ